MIIGILVSIGLAAIFFFQFFWMNKSEKRSIKQLDDLKKRTTICINAIVDNIVYESIRLSSDYNIYYYAIYKFVFNGNEYKIKSSISISKNLMNIGDII